MHRSTETNPQSSPEEDAERCCLNFPKGLFGFERAKTFHWIRRRSESPFGWLETRDGLGPSFLVVDPAEVVGGYHPQISDQDAVSLRLQRAEDAKVLAVVTQHESGRVTLNLKSPIVVNLRDQTGQQIIPRNVSAFTSRYPLAVHPT